MQKPRLGIKLHIFLRLYPGLDRYVNRGDIHDIVSQMLSQSCMNANSSSIKILST